MLKKIFDEEKIINEFNNNGVYFAIENDLKVSKIRGSFRVFNDNPVIYITKKHKKYADIYFALLHELAHCKSDFNRAKKGNIISNENDKSIEENEIKADKTAFNWMVEDKIYDKVKYNIDNINEYKTVKSFLVYRLVNDNIIKYSSNLYQENNKIINGLN